MRGNMFRNAAGPPHSFRIATGPLQENHGGLGVLGVRGMFTFDFRASFGSASGWWSSISVLLPFSTPSGDRLLAGSAATGTYHLMSVTETLLNLVSSSTVTDPAGTWTLSDAALVTIDGSTRLYSASHTGSRIDVQSVGSTGALTPLTPITSVGGVSMAVSSLEPIQLASGTYLATAAHDRGTLEILRLSATAAPVLVAQASDAPKTVIEGVTDMVSMTCGGQTYLIAASGQRDGISSFHIDGEGQMSLSDSLTSKDGLWVSGVDTLAKASIGGVNYVIAGSAAAGSLSVVRVNDLGVMFLTDHVLDTRDTRFDDVSRIKTVTFEGRCFVVAGGDDGGFSLMELLPDGKLFHHQSLEAGTESAVLDAGLTGLSVSVQGESLDIMAGGVGGLVRFSVDMSDVGPAITGTSAANSLTGGAADELIFGGGGADTLNGGAGDDILVASNSGASLTGGAGADVFRILPGSVVSWIRDFEQGVDRIDLSEWGRLYDVSALSISSKSYGAQISFGDQVLRVANPAGVGFVASDWGMDDFLFQ